MVDANIKIIEELKYFLEKVSTDFEFRKLVTQSEGDFSRDRKLTMERVVSFIINLPKRSLCVELQDFFSCIGNEPCTVTKGAFSLQRTKLKPIFFQVWNKWLVDNFYHYYGSNIKRWRGFILNAVDGSTAYLINRKEVVEYFGTQVNQHTSIPMARVVQVQDVLNDITIWGDIQPIGQSEQAIIAGNIDNLYKDSLTIFDRGFPSYSLMYLLMNEETPRHFVMRCKVDFNNEVKQFVQSNSNDQTVLLKPAPNAIKNVRERGHIITEKNTIKVRMVKIKLPTGEVEILLTNLYNKKLYTIDDLYYLYGLRWRIETTFGKQKNQQQMEQFSGHRVICIQQDYAASLFVANLQSLIEKQCEAYIQKLDARRKFDCKINRNVSWASLKYNIIKLFLHNETEVILSILQKAFERNVEPIRSGRHPPRVKKAKRLNGKYQTFTNYRRAV